VTINGNAAEVKYAGPPRRAVEDVFQVNVVILPQTPSGAVFVKSVVTAIVAV
jgi:uncharacterized protein (TIGR03437 family)